MGTITKQLVSLAGALSLSAFASAQATLDVAVVSQGTRYRAVSPGANIDYAVVARLGGDPGLGLCTFAFDLSFDGAVLPPADTPQAGTLAEFVAPRGINNPAGFGGTPIGGNLVQVGGAMNTIANTFAPAPRGDVVPGLGLGGFDTLITGSVAAPTAPGRYVFEATNGFANTLVEETPSGWWRVRGVEVNDPSALVVDVLDCGVDPTCAGTPNSLGCVAQASGSGVLSATGSGALTLEVDQVLNGVAGVFAWSLGDAAVPFAGGTLCVESPFVRELEPGGSGGTGASATNCGGTFTRVLDSNFVVSNGLAVGTSVYCQWLYRDPNSTTGFDVAFSGGVRVTVCP